MTVDSPLLSLVCDSARVGLVVINDQYEYLYANKTYMSFFDLQPEQIIGRKVQMYCHTVGRRFSRI